MVMRPPLKKSAGHIGPLTKLLLLTAQRRDEVAGMMRSRVDLGQSYMDDPVARRQKRAGPMTCSCPMPLSAFSNRCHVVADEGELIFTVTGETTSVGVLAGKTPA